MSPIFTQVLAQDDHPGPDPGARQGSVRVDPHGDIPLRGSRVVNVNEQTPPPPPPSSTYGQPSGAHPGATGPTPDAFDRFMTALRGLGISRRSDDKWIAGVCSGISDRFRVDPLIVRAAFILLGLTLGFGVTLYLVAWMLLPDRRGSIMAERAVRHGDGGAVTLLIITVLVATSGFGWLWGWGFGGFSGPGPLVPLLVVGVGIWIFVAHRDKVSDFRSMVTGPSAHQPQGHSSSHGTSHGLGHATYGGSSPSAGASVAPGPEFTSVVVPPVVTDGQASYVGSSYPPANPAPYRSSWQSPTPVPQPTIPPPPRRRRLGAALSWMVLGLAGAGGGATALLMQETDNADVAGRVGFAVALGILGLGMLIAGLAGRKAGALGFFGVLLALVTAVAVILPKDVTLTGPAGDEEWRPATVAAVGDYRLSAGDGLLDLTRMATPTSPTTIPARVAVGHLTVRVPAGVPVRIRSQVGIGSIDTDEAVEAETGWVSEVGGTDLDRTVNLGGTTPPQIIVNASVAIGQITIERS